MFEVFGGSLVRDVHYKPRISILVVRVCPGLKRKSFEVHADKTKPQKIRQSNKNADGASARTPVMQKFS
jgi:hypothetical protein